KPSTHRWRVEHLVGHLAALAQPLGAVLHEPYAGRVAGALDYIDEATHSLRSAAPNGDTEDLLGHLRHAVQQRGATCDHHARGEHVHVATLVHHMAHRLEDLFYTRLDDLGQHAARQHPWTTSTHGGHLDG